MGEGIAYDGLPFPGTDFPIQDVGFNNFIDLHQMV